MSDLFDFLVTSDTKGENIYRIWQREKGDFLEFRILNFNIEWVSSL